MPTSVRATRNCGYRTGTPEEIMCTRLAMIEKVWPQMCRPNSVSKTWRLKGKTGWTTVTLCSKTGARQVDPDYLRFPGVASDLPGRVLGVLGTGDHAPEQSQLLRTPVVQEPGVVRPRQGRCVLVLGDYRDLEQV